MSYDDVYGHVPISVHDIGFSLTMVFSRFLHRSSCLSFLFFPASLKCIDNMAAEQGPRRSTRINHNYTDYSMQEDVLTHTTSSGDERQGRRTPTVYHTQPEHENKWENGRVPSLTQRQRDNMGARRFASMPRIDKDAIATLA